MTALALAYLAGMGLLAIVTAGHADAPEERGMRWALTAVGIVAVVLALAGLLGGGGA